MTPLRVALPAPALPDAPEHYDHVRRKEDGLEAIVLRVGCGAVELSSTSSAVCPFTTDQVKGFWTRWVRIGTDPGSA